MRLIAPLLLSVALIQGTAAVAVAGCTQAAESAAHASAASVPLAPALRGKAVVARIHADWCAACKATAPTIQALRAKYGASIAFVEFDVTDAKTSASAAAKARRLGLSGFYEANKTATSTVAFVNPSTGTIVTKLYNDSNAGDYDTAIAQVRE
ncbi:MAG: hypothetical protein NVS4B13_07840 [Candidatus Elarobacter sp.]